MGADTLFTKNQAQQNASHASAFVNTELKDLISSNENTNAKIAKASEINRGLGEL